MATRTLTEAEVEGGLYVAGEAGVVPYQYGRLCERHAAWRNQRRLSMRQTHRRGEKLAIDYSGKNCCFIDSDAGVVGKGCCLTH